MRPTVGASAEEMFAGLGPWATLDGEATGWVVLHLCQAMVGSLDAVEDVIRDTDDGPGWSSYLDLSRAPDGVLPYLGQFPGVRVSDALTPAQQRAAIAATSGFARGTRASIIAAAQLHLTGTKHVDVYERLNGPYGLGVVTYTSETPDEPGTLAAIITQKPAGIVLSYVVRAGIIINALTGTINSLGGTIDSWAGTVPPNPNIGVDAGYVGGYKGYAP